MQTNWKYTKDSKSVYKTLEDGTYVSRPIEHVATEELAVALQADPTPAETAIADFVSQIQKRLDDFARTRGYDNILSACTYASSLVPKFKSEGQYCVEARDATWSAAYALMAEVQAGARPMPMLDEVLAALPVLAWPL